MVIKRERYLKQIIEQKRDVMSAYQGDSRMAWTEFMTYENHIINTME